MAKAASMKRLLENFNLDDDGEFPEPPKKLKNWTTASRHAQHKKRQAQFLSNRYILLDETDAPNAVESSQPLEKPCPPIIITQPLKNTKSFHETVKNWCTNVRFRCVNDQQQILTYKSDDYKNVQTKLKSSGIHYITFTPPSEKQKRVVMKGISGDYEEKDVLEDLKTQSQDVLNVTRMKSKRNGQLTELNMFLVSLKPTASVAKFAKSVQFCCHHKITLEHFVKPISQRGTQCYNCQQYGHVSRNCGQPYKCVKCDQNHQYGQCQKMEEAPPVCANCHGPHTASFRGCPEAKKYLNKINPKITFTAKNSTNNNQRYSGTSQVRRRQSVTYSSIVKDASNSNQQHSGTYHARSRTGKNGSESENKNPLFSFNDEIQKLFGQNLLTVMKKISDFMPNYLKVKNSDQKKLMLVEFLFEIMSNGNQ